MSYFSTTRPSNSSHIYEKLSGTEQNALVEKWGKEAVEDLMSEAQDLFVELDQCRDGLLELNEFATALGVMGCRNSPLAKLLFRSLDINGDGHLNFFEFFSWMLLMLHGSLGDKLSFGYHLMDLNHDNYITRDEMVFTLQSLFDVLTTLKINPPDLTEFVNTLWEMLNIGQQEGISLDEYKEAALKNLAFIQSLGGFSKPYTSHVSENVNHKVFFGQKKWDIMLSVMCSLQISLDKIQCEPRLPMADYGIDQFKTLAEVERFDVPTHANGVVTVNSYFPQVFRELRYLSNIDDDSFINSVGIKQDNPDSLLTRYYGLYKLKNNTSITYFIVMGNLFPAADQMDIRFDLKGSSRGRTSLGVSVTDFTDTSVIYKDLDWLASAHRLSLGPKVTPILWSQVIRDAQFLRDHNIIDYSLLVGIQHHPDAADNSLDAWVKKSEGILKEGFDRLKATDETGSLFDLMNYDQFCQLAYQASSSGATTDNQKEKDGRLSGLSFGPFNCYEIAKDDTVLFGNQVVFLGIIDTLVSYDTLKQGESFVKGIVHGKNEASVVPPGDYRNRFLRFIRMHVLEGLPPYCKPEPLLEERAISTN
eukprot:Ihof_evm2s115 gene=Ihof_evmTU2s115